MTVQTETTAWPDVPCPSDLVELRTSLVQLEHAAGAALSASDCDALARWLAAYTAAGARDPRLFLLGAGLLVNSADALAHGADAAVSRATAYHEAGHAVIALLAGRPVLKVTIEPDPIGGSLGCCYLEARTPATGDAARAQAEAHAEITLAGVLAEGLSGATPTPVAVAGHRDEALHELLAAGPLNGQEELEAHLDYLRERVRGRLQQCWNAVDVLARHLLTARSAMRPEVERLILAALPAGITLRHQATDGPER